MAPDEFNHVYLTGSFMISGTSHIQLTTSDGGKLGVKLLEDSLICILSVKKILWLLEPVIGCAKVSNESC
jgi:hypothetical protein